MDKVRLVRRVVGLLLAALLMGIAVAPVANAQYGGISGLYVTTSPDRPGFADFTGLGCNGGEEVILYFPGLAPTSADPQGSQSVPGRILAVTTSITSADALLNGTFSFPNVRLPDVEPGVYEVHSRCGGLDLRVLIQIDIDGRVTLDPGSTTPILNETPTDSAIDGAPGTLPFTGRNSDRVVSLSVGLIAAGVALMAASRRHLSVRPALQNTHEK